MTTMLKKKDWSTLPRRALTATEVVANLAKLEGWSLSGDGANVAIENFDDVGLAVARAAVAAGAKITAISTSAGAAISDDGFDLGALATTWRIDGPGMITGATGADGNRARRDAHLAPMLAKLAAKCADLLPKTTAAGEPTAVLAAHAHQA